MATWSWATVFAKMADVYYERSFTGGCRAMRCAVRVCLPPPPPLPRSINPRRAERQKPGGGGGGVLPQEVVRFSPSPFPALFIQVCDIHTLASAWHLVIHWVVYDTSHTLGKCMTLMSHTWKSVIYAFVPNFLVHDISVIHYLVCDILANTTCSVWIEYEYHTVGLTERQPDTSDGTAPETFEIFKRERDKGRQTCSWNLLYWLHMANGWSWRWKGWTMSIRWKFASKRCWVDLPFVTRALDLSSPLPPTNPLCSAFVL